jgi:hypothetical protein
MALSVQVNWDATEYVDCARKIASVSVLREILKENQYFMVLLGRMELPASSLPMTRSTTELQQPIKSRALKHTPY